MAKSKTMVIAFANGGLLASSVMGTKSDLRVGPGEPATVPFAYGRHLVDDRFAYEVSGAASSKSQSFADAEAAVSKASQRLADAKDDAERVSATTALATAEQALADLKA